MNEFKTQVDLDLFLEGYDNHDVDTKKVNIRWNLEFDMRSYGVKDMVITVPDQKINVSLTLWGDEEDTYKEITLDVKDVIVERDFVYSSLMPSSLEFSGGKWRLVF